MRYNYVSGNARDLGRQDKSHRGAQGGVTTRAFGRRTPPIVRIACTSCPPFKLAVVGCLPAEYLGRGPGPLYIGLATTIERDRLI